MGRSGDDMGGDVGMADDRLTMAQEALLERRALLRRMGVTAAGVAATGGLAALLAGCANDGEQATPDNPSTTGSLAPAATLAPYAFDPASPYWLQHNFAPVADEIESTTLEVTGALPPELEGLYVRNGSNPMSGTSPHWFLADGMVHGVRLSAGDASWYRNRYVQTPYIEAGGGDLLSLGQPPGKEANQSNVSVFVHGGRLLSSGEVGWPYELSPDDLSTVGPYDFGGKLATAMTAHPKIDPRTGRMHFFGYGFFPPYLTYHVADETGALVLSQEIEVAGPTMIHDFAITDREAIFWELPVVFDLGVAIEGGMPYSWDPSYGARLGVMPLEGPATDIRWVDIEPAYVFHGVNAYRQDDLIVLDVCRLPSVFGEGEGALGAAESSRLHRWSLDTAGDELRWSDERLNEIDMDLPSIDRRFTGRPNRYGWFAETVRGPGYLDFAGVTQWDFQTSSETRWDPGPGRHAGEVFFVEADEGEGEGWLLTYVYDEATDRSSLAVVDASDLAAGPVAEVALPQRVPYGFHGTWVPSQPSA